VPLTEIKAEIPAAAAETTETALLELGDGRWSVLEDAIARRAWVVGIFPGAAAAAAAWRQLEPLLAPGPLGPPEQRTLADRDWRESYRSHFHASRFGHLHWVPVWERAAFSLPAGHAVLWLDPGLAFGTGNHETTRLCCERLVGLAHLAPAGRVIDAGCGSGILALSAARLGFVDVRAFDLDPEAIAVSAANAALNGLEGRVDFRVADLAEGLGGRPADLVMANIQADVLLRARRELLAAVAPRGTLALSGILASEQAAVQAAFAEAAPTWEIDSRVLGEWCDIALRRP
jgi:ribosomal protein L11 methyltransferase